MGFAILQGIMQSFLGDAEQAQRDIPRQMLRYIHVGELDAYLVLLGELSAEGPDSGHNAKAVERGGV